jgi:hypothetical protein
MSINKKHLNNIAKLSTASLMLNCNHIEALFLSMPGSAGFRLLAIFENIVRELQEGFEDICTGGLGTDGVKEMIRKLALMAGNAVQGMDCLLMLAFKHGVHTNIVDSLQKTINKLDNYINNKPHLDTFGLCEGLNKFILELTNSNPFGYVVGMEGDDPVRRVLVNPFNPLLPAPVGPVVCPAPPGSQGIRDMLRDALGPGLYSQLTESQISEMVTAIAKLIAVGSLTLAGILAIISLVANTLELGILATARIAYALLAALTAWCLGEGEEGEGEGEIYVKKEIS